MRRTNRTRPFRRDYRREMRGRYRETLDADLDRVVALLANDQPLPAHYEDHAMRRSRGRERNCHLKPDLVLIYRKPNPEELELLRLGSHSEIRI